MGKYRWLVLCSALCLVAGMWCRWEEWSYTDQSGAPVFRYRGLLLPWQEVQAPTAGPPVTTVAVQKWSCYGFNRFDYSGPPTPSPSSTARATGGMLQ